MSAAQLFDESRLGVVFVELKICLKFASFRGADDIPHVVIEHSNFDSCWCSRYPTVASVFGHVFDQRRHPAATSSVLAWRVPAPIGEGGCGLLTVGAVVGNVRLVVNHTIGSPLVCCSRCEDFL